MKKIKKFSLAGIACLSVAGLACVLSGCDFASEETWTEYNYTCSKVSGTDFYKRQTLFYTGLTDSVTKEKDTRTITAYYKEGEEICYVDVLEMTEAFSEDYTSSTSGYDPDWQFTYEDGKATASYVGQGGVRQSIVIDASDNSVVISSPNYYSLYFEGEGHSSYDEFDYDINAYAQNSFSFDLDDYNLSAYNIDGKVLLPSAIYDLIYTQEIGIDYYYIDGILYADSGNESYQGVSTTAPTEAIRELTYNYFLLFFHKYYGLSPYKGLTTVAKIEEFLSPYKDAILSTYRSIFEPAEQKIFGELVDDPHSGVNRKSIYHRETYTVESSYGDRTYAISENYSKYSSLRESASTTGVTSLTTSAGVEVAKVYGDTAFISFDEFAYISAKNDISDEKYVGSDTDTLMYVALQKIGAYSANTQTINNVVVDLTTNTGGYVIEGMGLLSFMTNDTITYTYDYLDTNTHGTWTVNVDNDNDGDTTDDDAYTQYNWFIETSNVSFSCGNLVPFLAKEYGYATILGGTSSGGMCVVGTGVLPDGTYFQKSSPLMRNCAVNETSDSRSCEDGVLPDKGFSYNLYYDYAYISSLCDTLSA